MEASIARRHRTWAVAALAGATLLVVVASASGARRATRSERAQLVSAIHHYHRGITHPGRVHVLKILISTKGPWAKLRLVLPISGGTKDRALSLAHKINGQWRIVTVGSAGVGCGLPPAVASDLHLDTTCFDRSPTTGATAASTPVVEAPATVAAGGSAEITVYPQPQSTSDFISAISTVAASSCPDGLEGFGPPPQWELAVSANAHGPAPGFVRAGADQAGSRILVCAYQGAIGEPDTARLIGYTTMTVVAADAPTSGHHAKRRKKRHVFLKIQGWHLKVAPSAIYPSPTSGPFAKGLSTWHGWGTGRTYAEGTTYYDTCTPDCASGFGHTRGRVTLSAVHRCGRQLHYLRLRFVYFGALEHNLHVGFNCKGVAKHVHIG